MLLTSIFKSDKFKSRERVNTYPGLGLTVEPSKYVRKRRLDMVCKPPAARRKH